MDPALFDFVLTPALTNNGSGRMVRVTRTPEGRVQPHSFKRDVDRQFELEVPAADAENAAEPPVVPGRMRVELRGGPLLCFAILGCWTGGSSIINFGLSGVTQ